MKKQKSLLNLTILLSILAIEFIYLPKFSKKTLAQNNQILNFDFSQDVNFYPDGSPLGDTGGGTRGNFCRDVTPTPNLTALIPKTNYTKTIQSHPTIYVYLPHSNIIYIDLILYEQNNQGEWIDYFAPISFNSQEGIIPISFSELPPLEEGKIYKWSLIVSCQDLGYFSIPLFPDNDSFIPINQAPEAYPTIQRVSLDEEIEEISVENALSYIENDQILEAFDIAMMYAQKGLFLETTDILFHLKQKNPDNEMILSAWEQLLIMI